MNNPAPTVSTVPTYLAQLIPRLAEFTNWLASTGRTIAPTTSEWLVLRYHSPEGMPGVQGAIYRNKRGVVTFNKQAELDWLEWSRGDVAEKLPNPIATVEALIEICKRIELNIHTPTDIANGKLLANKLFQ